MSYKIKLGVDTSSLDKIGKSISDQFSKAFKNMNMSKIGGMFTGGGAGGLENIPILGSILGIITAIWGLIVQTSPPLQRMLKLFGTIVSLILFPIGTFIALLLKPFLLLFMRYFVMPWIRFVMPLLNKMSPWLDKVVENLFNLEILPTLKDIYNDLKPFLSDPNFMKSVAETIFGFIVIVIEVLKGILIFIKAILDFLKGFWGGLANPSGAGLPYIASRQNVNLTISGTDSLGRALAAAIVPEVNRQQYLTQSRFSRP